MYEQTILTKKILKSTKNYRAKNYRAKGYNMLTESLSKGSQQETRIEERISELLDKSVEIKQTEEQKEKRMKRN